MAGSVDFCAGLAPPPSEARRALREVAMSPSTGRATKGFLLRTAAPPPPPPPPAAADDDDGADKATTVSEEVITAYSTPITVCRGQESVAR